MKKILSKIPASLPLSLAVVSGLGFDYFPQFSQYFIGAAVLVSAMCIFGYIAMRYNQPEVGSVAQGAAIESSAAAMSLYQEMILKNQTPDRDAEKSELLDALAKSLKEAEASLAVNSQVWSALEKFRFLKVATNLTIESMSVHRSGSNYLANFERLANSHSADSSRLRVAIVAGMTQNLRMTDFDKLRALLLPSDNVRRLSAVSRIEPDLTKKSGLSEGLRAAAAEKFYKDLLRAESEKIH